MAPSDPGAEQRSGPLEGVRPAMAQTFLLTHINHGCAIATVGQVPGVGLRLGGLGGLGGRSSKPLAAVREIVL